VYVYNTKAHNPKNNGNSNNHLPKTGQQIKGQLILSSVGALLVTLVFVAIKKRKRSNR
jgi:LPXTG-motif cell wall-anchored protein